MCIGMRHDVVPRGQSAFEPTRADAARGGAAGHVAGSTHYACDFGSYGLEGVAVRGPAGAEDIDRGRGSLLSGSGAALGWWAAIHQCLWSDRSDGVCEHRAV